eukprot:COSAG04_NODE_1624_length_6127_cov_3.358162_9_plen_125_part_00
MLRQYGEDNACGQPASCPSRTLCTGGALNCPFPMFAKSTVNVPMCANPPSAGCTPDSDECCTFNNQVYTYLRGELPGAIPWNFAKFLIGKDGTVIKRWKSVTEPDEMIPDIQAALAAECGRTGH